VRPRGAFFQKEWHAVQVWIRNKRREEKNNKGINNSIKNMRYMRLDLTKKEKK